MSKQASQRSRELFQSGFYCAESVLQAVAESQGIRSELIPRIATGFCSGISRSGGMCGAVSGAIMGIGLAAGRDSSVESVETVYALVSELLRRFEQRFGSVNCQGLIDCDLATEEGLRHFMENNLIERCYQFAEEATGQAISLVAELPQSRAS